MYNSNLENMRMSTQTPCFSLGKTHGFPTDLSVNPESLANRSDFKVRDSSTSGKVPLHGPRRMVCPNRVLINDFIGNEDKFKPSPSELANYKAICALASSRSSK